jgi:hypothetical protein
MAIRDISTDNVNALNSAVVRPILFARMDFSSGVKRFHTEIGPREAVHPIYGAETYLGIGAFGGITGDIKETISSAPESVSISLTGVDPDMIADATTDDYHRRDIELMFGFDDEQGELLDDPVIVWSGYMDHVVISLGQNTGELTLICESRGTNGRGRADLRFTDEDKQAANSGDLVAEYVYRMVDLVLRWGGGNVQGGSGRPLFNYSVPRS